jgi:hypothetical protein
MPAQANANVVALQLEKVRDKVPLLYERDDILLTMIQQRGDVEKVSSRNMRLATLPVASSPGTAAPTRRTPHKSWREGHSTCRSVSSIARKTVRQCNYDCGSRLGR